MQRRPPSPSRTSRRAFLTHSGLVIAGAAALAACGGDDGGSGTGPEDGGGNGDTTSPTGATGDGSGAPFILVQRWPSTSLTPGLVRLPLSIAEPGGLLPTGPQELRGQIVDAMSGDVVVGEVVAVRHGDDLPIAYWPFRVELDEGLYILTVDGGSPDGAAIQVRPAADFPVPKVGDALPPFDTPTMDNARGLDPICTAEGGPCALHGQTLTEALTKGLPVAYLIGTPAFCQTGTCAPALDSLLDVHARVGETVAMVHAEVYTDMTATTVAEAVRAYSMDYEPALFVTDASGIVVARLDAVFDTSEIEAALRAAGAAV